MAKTVKTKVLLRNDTARRWTSNNPTLGKGEIGIEIDTRKFKFGDGTKTWTQLPYASAADVSWNSANKKLVKDDGTVDIVRFTEGTGIDLTATASGLQIAVDKTELSLSASDIDLSSLVDTLTGTPGSGKTVTAFDQVDGKVSATFGNISITHGQVSDWASNIGVDGVTWDSTNKQIKRSSNGGTARAVVGFTEGTGIDLTASANGLSIAADLSDFDAGDLSVDTFTTGGGQTISDANVQASIERLSTEVENAVAGGGEVNQNAFSHVAVSGQTTVDADSKTDTVNFAAGTGIEITTNASTDTITISGLTAIATGETGARAGLMSAADKAKLDDIPDTRDVLEAGTGISITEGTGADAGKLIISATTADIVSGLDGVITGTPGAAKTLTAFSETDGVVTATFSDIAIANTQVSGLGTAATRNVSTQGAVDGDTGLVTGDQVADAIAAAVSSAFTYKGVKADVASLPSSGNKVGDVWHVTADDGEYAWDGSQWEALGGIVDLSNYYTKTQSDSNYVSAVAAGTNNGYVAVTKNGTTSQVKAYELPSTTLDSSDELILDCGDSQQEIPSQA